MKPTQITNFTDKFLIASPGVEKENFFRKSLVYMLHHGNEGALGLIINQPINNFMHELEGNISFNNFKLELYLGGPVSTEKKFFLYSGDYKKRSPFLNVNPNINVSLDSDILKDIANGEGPLNTMVVVGYSSWRPGQLEVEIENNFWIVSESDSNLIFQKDYLNKWDLALSKVIKNTDYYIHNIVIA